MIDDIVKKVERVLIPEFERRKSQIAADTDFFGAEIISIRHAHVLHTVGLRCPSIALQARGSELTIYVNIFEVDGILIRGFVSWRRRSGRALEPEGNLHIRATKPFRLEGSSRLESFFDQMTDLLAAFDRELSRRRPPSKLLQAWNALIHPVK